MCLYDVATLALYLFSMVAVESYSAILQARNFGAAVRSTQKDIAVKHQENLDKVVTVTACVNAMIWAKLQPLPPIHRIPEHYELSMLWIWTLGASGSDTVNRVYKNISSNIFSLYNPLAWSLGFVADQHRTTFCNIYHKNMPAKHLSSAKISNERNYVVASFDIAKIRRHRSFLGCASRNRFECLK